MSVKSMSMNGYVFGVMSMRGCLWVMSMRGCVFGVMSMRGYIFGVMSMRVMSFGLCPTIGHTRLGLAAWYTTHMKYETDTEKYMDT